MASVKVDSLLILAAEDLALASQPTTPARPAAYHLSQAAEKAARAVCEYENIPVGTTHNIGQIGALLPADHPFKEIVVEQDYHSPASTRYRYPDPSGRLPKELSRVEIEHRIQHVNAFLKKVREFVSGTAQSPGSKS